jgi:hypothetical protein
LSEESIIAIETLQLIISTFDEFTIDWDEDEESRELELNQDLKDALKNSE